MSEALRIHMPAATPATDYRDVLPDVLPAAPPVEVNDNEIVIAPREGERRLFEMPGGVWKTMIACYGVFLAALLSATGGGHAAFAIIISLVYVFMFFGTAAATLRQGPPQSQSVLGRSGAVLQTAYGPLARREVFGQMLVVPAAIAFFGVAILVLSAILT